MLLCVWIGTTASLSASAFTNWTEDPSDPIYTPYPLTTALYDDYFPCVLFNANKFNGDGDSVLYKMWHQGSGIATGTLALSTSNDGIHWTLKGDTNLVALPGFDVGHPCVVYDQNGFGGGPFKYKMWFWDGTQGTTLNIFFTQSTDGFVWTPQVLITQNPASPLVDGILGSYFQHIIGPGFVIFNPTPTFTPGMPYSFPYVMFYDAAAFGNVPGNASQEEVALAYSSDGLFWTRFGSEPVLIPSGNAADWDGIYNFRASVIKVQGIYHMFYSGSDGNGATGTSFAHGLGTASSPDGINWTKDPANPIFINTNGVAWRNDRTYTPCVLFDQNNFGDSGPRVLKMWFVGGNQPYTLGQAIGYATLPNPIPLPLPPRKFHGKIKRKFHLKHEKNFSLKMKWKASKSQDVASYRIYKKNKLIKEISSTSALRFTRFIHTLKHIRKLYSITSVTVDNLESVHKRLKIVEIEDHDD